MLALAFLKWWYGPGWAAQWALLPRTLRRTYYSYSLPQIARTLFAPWRRIITPSGGSLPDRFRALIDNAVSRFIGAIVRLGTIIIALLIMIGMTIIYVVIGIIWPLLPVSGLGLALWGLL